MMNPTRHFTNSLFHRRPLFRRKAKTLSPEGGTKNAIPRRSSFVAICAAIFAVAEGPGVLAVQSASGGEASLPNIIFILADDLGSRDLASYGAVDIKTPQIDQLAREGVRFTQFYSNGSECSPTRTAFLTGRYQQRVGGLECAIGLGNVGRYDDAIRLANKGDLGLPASEISIAALLQKGGYSTALSGKWHLGYDDKFSPNHHGFEHAFYCIGGGMDYFHHVEPPPELAHALRLDGHPIERRGYFTDLVADDAVEWLHNHVRKETNRPFFLYVPFTSPHSPFQGPADDRPLPAGSPLWNQSNAPAMVYAAMIESMDAAIGRILAAVEEHGLTGRTMVVFTSDNGGTASARPSGLRGMKTTTFEGGIRVPCIVRWPGVMPSGVDYPYPAATFDLTASLARASGVAPVKKRAFDGIDILRLAETGAAPPARALFWRGRRGERTWRAVREREWKYVSLQSGARFEEWLFNLDTDPAETMSLLSERPEDVARLKAKLAAWEEAVRPER